MSAIEPSAHFLPQKSTVRGKYFGEFSNSLCMDLADANNWVGESRRIEFLTPLLIASKHKANAQVSMEMHHEILSLSPYSSLDFLDFPLHFEWLGPKPIYSQRFPLKLSYHCPPETTQESRSIHISVIMESLDQELAHSEHSTQKHFATGSKQRATSSLRFFPVTLVLQGRVVETYPEQTVEDVTVGFF